MQLTDNQITALRQSAIFDTQTLGQSQRKTVAKEWLRANLLGNAVIISDNKRIHFNSNDTINHISYNVRRNDLLVKCLPFVAMTFAFGEFAGREISEPAHQENRTDQSILAFHLYQKWIMLNNGYCLHIEVQACEREKEGEKFYSAYNLKILTKKKTASP